MRKVLFILGELAESDLSWLVSAGRAERVAAGETIIREGEPLESLFVTLEGSLSVGVSGAEVARLGAGEIVGEMSLLDSRPPNATVKAAQDAIVFRVPQELFRAKLRSDPGLSSRFYRALCIFLADRLGRTTSLVAREGINIEREEDGDDELSPELLDNVSLAGARFDWFIEKAKAKRN